MRALVPLVLLALPIAEIAMFVVVGSHIGVLATIGLVVASSVAGILLLRHQGLGNLARLRMAVQSGDAPAGEVADGVMILLAGLLLITPGFITGALGLLLFVPPLRRAFWKLAGLRMAVVVARPGGPGERIIDLDSEDYRREPPQPYRRIDGR